MSRGKYPITPSVNVLARNRRLPVFSRQISRNNEKETRPKVLTTGCTSVSIHAHSAMIALIDAIKRAWVVLLEIFMWRSGAQQADASTRWPDAQEAKNQPVS